METDEVSDGASKDTVEAFPPDYSFITIVLDGEGAPHLDLGDISPYTAISIFESCVDTLRDVLIPPRVTYKNRPVAYDFDDDDDDWDDEDD